MTPGNGPYDWRQMRDQRRMQKMQWHMQRRAWRDQHRGPGHGIVGVILLIVGVVFLLTNLGVFQTDYVRRYWPAILIVLGAGHVLGFGGRFSGGTSAHRSLWGGMWMVMGGLLLAQNLGYVRGDMWEVFWPVGLIFMGIAFLLRTHERRTLPPGTAAGAAPGSPAGDPAGASNPISAAANRLNEVSVFGGINRRIESQDFEGGHLTAVFGGIELDLRKANTKRDEIVIEANAVCGGIELMVPEGWRVSVQGAGIFGGYEDQTRPGSSPLDAARPHLIMTGAAVFGGVSVRN